MRKLQALADAIDLLAADAREIETEHAPHLYTLLTAAWHAAEADLRRVLGQTCCIDGRCPTCMHYRRTSAPARALIHHLRGKL